MAVDSNIVRDYLLPRIVAKFGTVMLKLLKRVILFVGTRIASDQSPQPGNSILGNLHDLPVGRLDPGISVIRRCPVAGVSLGEADSEWTSCYRNPIFF